MKVKRFSLDRLLAGALAVLGFSACSGDDDMEKIQPEMYGTPTVRFQVKGQVTDESGNPLDSIRVIVRDKYGLTVRDESGNYLNQREDTVYTDREGNFCSHDLSAGSLDDARAVFQDIDGERNGGEFRTDSVQVEKMELKQIEEGDSFWNQGTYEADARVKLKKK